MREKAVENINLPKEAILTIPVSANGELPATHWFCRFKVSEEMYDKLMSIKHLSEMEDSDAKSFLKDRNLKLISK